MPQNHYGMGVAVGDYDNDGFADIYVTNYGGNTLYRNNGDGTFADVTKAPAWLPDGWSASAGFFDYDNDGRLDLFVTRYVDWTFQTNRYCGESKPGYRAYCHPDNFEGSPTSSIATTATARSPTCLAKPGLPVRSARDSASRSPITTTTGSWTCTSPTTPCSRSCFATTATARSPRSACWPASGSTRTARRLPAWAWTSPTTTTTAVRTSSSRISRTSATGCFGTTATAAFAT